MNSNKSVFQSKTLWINLLMAGAAFFPSVNAWIGSHPDAFALGFSVVNMILRMISKDKLELS
jgi:hypothetical protein